jgi:hypothetical protein
MNPIASFAGNTKVKATAFILFLCPFALQNFFTGFKESYYILRWKYKSKGYRLYTFFMPFRTSKLRFDCFRA